MKVVQFECSDNDYSYAIVLIEDKKYYYGMDYRFLTKADIDEIEQKSKDVNIKYVGDFFKHFKTWDEAWIILDRDCVISQLDEGLV